MIPNRNPPNAHPSNPTVLRRPPTRPISAIVGCPPKSSVKAGRSTSFVGWSDGACTALILARNAALRSAGVFFFACKMDPSGLKDIERSPALSRCLARHRKDYAQLSTTPDQFATFAEAVGRMQRTEPNYSIHDLARVHVPVAIVQGEHDEFIKLEHAEYLAGSIPGAELILLPGVSHFAPLQRPEKFNQVMLTFLGKLPF